MSEHEGEQSFTDDNDAWDWGYDGADDVDGDTTSCGTDDAGIPYRVMAMLDRVMTHLEGLKLEEQSIHQIKELVDVVCDLGEYDKKHNPASNKIVVQFIGEADELSR